MNSKAGRQRQLILPLLEAVDAAGGQISTSEAYAAVAAITATPADVLAQTRSHANRSVNVFCHDVRWAQQQAKFAGLMRRLDGGDWEITDRGKAALHKATPGLVITIFTTAAGVALYADCSDAAALIEDQSIALVMTSPPYPLLRKKAYGNEDERAYVDWLLRHIERWPRILTKTGSLVLNLGEVWRSGSPTLSTYQERLVVRLEDELGFRLCQRFSWHNPSKMPVPAEWVTIRRVRVKPSVEQVLWFSQNEHPYADNRAVLVPYSESMKQRIASGGEAGARRPAGYDLKPGAFGQDNGGAIPGSLIVAANTASGDSYQRLCRAEGLPIHPARFPQAVPDFFIRMLTRAGETVFDPFGGSSTTGAVAEQLDRRWISSEQIYEYVRGARHRFPDAVMA